MVYRPTAHEFDDLPKIEFIDSCPYQVFLEQYLKPCVPVLIGPKLTAQWKANTTWITSKGDPNILHSYILPDKPCTSRDNTTGNSLLNDNDIKNFIRSYAERIVNNEDKNVFLDSLLLSPNYEYLEENYGTIPVPLAYCNEKDRYGSQRRETVPLKSALHELRDEQVQLQCRQAPSNQALKSLYAKDMHLFRHLDPADFPYSTPDIFADDWLNAYVIDCESDDFRFAYLGSHLTTTGLHTDVYASHSFSVNLCGVKCWLFIDPKDLQTIASLYDDQQLPSWITKDDLFRGPLVNHRHLIKILFQYPGQTVFVPSGWYHQVLNIGTTLSINHNWCNASCILQMYTALKEQYEVSAESLKDLLEDGIVTKDRFSQVVTEVVEANYGWCWRRFWGMIKHQLKRRDAILHNSEYFSKWPIQPEFLPQLSWEYSILKNILLNDEPGSTFDSGSPPSSIVTIFKSLGDFKE